MNQFECFILRLHDHHYELRTLQSGPVCIHSNSGIVCSHMVVWSTSSLPPLSFQSAIFGLSFCHLSSNFCHLSVHCVVSEQQGVCACVCVCVCGVCGCVCVCVGVKQLTSSLNKNSLSLFLFARLKMVSWRLFRGGKTLILTSPSRAL